MPEEEGRGRKGARSAPLRSINSYMHISLHYFIIIDGANKVIKCHSNLGTFAGCLEIFSSFCVSKYRTIFVNFQVLLSKFSNEPGVHIFADLLLPFG